MKKIIIIYISVFLFANTLLGQMKKQGILVNENPISTTSTLKANDIETFKNQFAKWNVGNLHLYSQSEESINHDYYFFGKEVSPYFQQYFPKTMRSDFKEEGMIPYSVASIRGKGLRNYYILRTNSDKGNNLLGLYELKNKVLKLKKKLAYFYQKKGKTYQRDSWIQDLNGDTRLDIIQKTLITNSTGDIIKEKTRVYLQKENGKFKRTKKIKIGKSEYKLEPIQ